MARPQKQTVNDKGLISWKVSNGYKSREWGIRALMSLHFTYLEAIQYLDNRNDYLRKCIAKDVERRLILQKRK